VRVAAAAAAAVILVAVVVGLVASHLLSPVDPRAPAAIVVVPPGASTSEIGALLRRAGVIRASSHFVIAARFRRTTNTLREGEYRLSPAMPLLRIVDVLARGEVVLHPVTIPEGYTAEQIVQTLVRGGLGDPARLRALVRSGAGEFEYDFLRGLPGGSLEGYLYPDTYYVPRFLEARQVLDRFLAHFAQTVLPLWRDAGTDRTLHEIVTVASMVEREAKSTGDQALIAGVIYNRLARGWRLEVDATVLYALGGHKPVLTYADLKVNSPYNTYLHTGLPPGPIANPGLGAIKAALRPARTDYFFYVARPDGSHAFSRTLAEHLANVRRYRRP
jgi:UPF0755 protein